MCPHGLSRSCSSDPLWLLMRKPRPRRVKGLNQESSIYGQEWSQDRDSCSGGQSSTGYPVIASNLVAEIYLKICFETLQNWKYRKVHTELTPSRQSGQQQKDFEMCELGCKTLVKLLYFPMWQASHRSVTPDLCILIHLSHKLIVFLLLPGAPEDTARGESVDLTIIAFSYWCLHLRSAYNLDLAIILRVPVNHLMKRSFTNPG